MAGAGSTKKNRPGRPRAKTGRRPELLEIARQVISKSGYGGASMRMIGEHAGITAAAFYNHFESKDELLSAIVLESSERLIAILSAELARGGEPLQQLQNLVRAHLRFTCDNLEVSKIILEEARFLKAVDCAVAREKQTTILNFYRSCLLQLQQQGKLQDANPTLCAFNIIAVINGFYRWFRPGKRGSLEEAVDSTTRFILGGLLQPAVD
jgi:AcrR family transcriptional regulator